MVHLHYAAYFIYYMYPSINISLFVQKQFPLRSVWLSKINLFVAIWWLRVWIFLSMVFLLISLDKFKIHHIWFREMQQKFEFFKTMHMVVIRYLYYKVSFLLTYWYYMIWNGSCIHITNVPKHIFFKILQGIRLIAR